MGSTGTKGRPRASGAGWDATPATKNKGASATTTTTTTRSCRYAPSNQQQQSGTFCGEHMTRAKCARQWGACTIPARPIREKPRSAPIACAGSLPARELRVDMVA